MVDFLSNDEIAIERLKVNGIFYLEEIVPYDNEALKLYFLHRNDPMSWGYVLQPAVGNAWNVACWGAFFSRTSVEANLKSASVVVKAVGYGVAMRAIHYYGKNWGCSLFWVARNLDRVKQEFRKFLEVG